MDSSAPIPKAKISPIFVSLVLIGSALAGLLWATFGLLGHYPIRTQTFLAFLGIHYLAAILLVVYLWRQWRTLSIMTKAQMMTWCGIIVWWYFPGAVLLIATIRIDSTQLAWMSFIWMIEAIGLAVPLMGGITYALIRPFARIEDGFRAQNPKLLYEASVNAPRRIAVITIGVTAMSTAVALVILHRYAFLPATEQWILVMHTLSGSLFVSIVLFLTFDRLLQPTRRRLKQDYRLTDGVFRSFSARMFAASAILLIGMALLGGTFAFRGYETLIIERLKEQLEDRMKEAQGILADIQQFASPAERAREQKRVVDTLRMGGRGIVYLGATGNDFPLQQFAPDSIKIAVEGSSSGMLSDLRHENKLIAYLHNTPGGKNIISVVFLKDFMEPFWQAMRVYLLGSLLLLGILLAILIFFVLETTLPLSSFVKSIRALVKNLGPFLDDPATADELDECAHGLRQYSARMEERWQSMEKNCQEEIASLENKNTTLEKLNRFMIQRELQMIELKKELDALKQKNSAASS